MALVGFMQTRWRWKAPKDGIRVNYLAPTAATRMTEGPDAGGGAREAGARGGDAGADPSRLDPTRRRGAILCAGAGTFERAYITLTQGVHIGTGADAAEQVAARFAEISEREGEIVPDNGSAQGSNEVGKSHAGALTPTRTIRGFLPRRPRGIHPRIHPCSSPQAFAQAAPAAPAAPESFFGSLGSMLPLLLMFVVLTS